MSAFDHAPMTGDVYEEEPAALGDTFDELEDEEADEAKDSAEDE